MNTLERPDLGGRAFVDALAKTRPSKVRQSLCEHLGTPRPWRQSLRGRPGNPRRHLRGCAVMGPTWGQHEPAWANLRRYRGQQGPTWASLGQHGPIWGDLGVNLGPTWDQLGPTCANMEPTWSQLGANLGPTWGELGPTRANLVPTWPNLAPI